MQLYNTKVIPATGDAAWTLPEGLPDLTGSVMLVISTNYAAGSTEEQTLLKMMTACKLSPADFNIIQVDEGRPLSWQALAGAGAPSKVLLLGVTPAQLSIHSMFQLNSCNAFAGCTFIPSYPLTEIVQNNAIRRELWEQGLKPCFGL